MVGEIELGHMTYFDIVGVNDPNPNNALLVFQHDGSYHFYHLSINHRLIPKGTKSVEPLEFKVISSYKKDCSGDEAKKEMELLTSLDGRLGGMLLKQVDPLDKDLEYKLNLGAVLYVLCKDYVVINDNPSEDIN